MEALKNQIEAKRAEQRRPVHVFTIPETLRNGGRHKVGMCQLSASQEELASKIGRLEYMKSQYAAVKLSIVELDDKPVSNSEGEVDVFWEKADGKLRSLLLQQYNRMSSPTTDETEVFFKSEEVRV